MRSNKPNAIVIAASLVKGQPADGQSLANSLLNQIGNPVKANE